MLAHENSADVPQWLERDVLIETTQRIASMVLSDPNEPTVQQTAAAMWLILKLSSPPFESETDSAKAASKIDSKARLTSDSPSPSPRPALTELDLIALDEMLATTASHSEFSENLRSLARGNPISRAALLNTDITPWLRRRLLVQSRFPNAPLGQDSKLLDEERSYITRSLMLQTAIALMSVLGLLLIVLFAVKRPPRALHAELSPPWDNDWWIGWYVPLAWFLSYQAVSLAVVQCCTLLDIANSQMVGMQLIAQGLSLGIALWLIKHLIQGQPTIAGVVYRLKLGLAPLGGQAVRCFGYAVAVVAIASPVVMIATQLAELLPVQAREHVAILQFMEASQNSPNYLAELSLLLTVTVGAPMCEETVFRGFMYRHLRARHGIKGGVVISAAAFACVHGSLSSLIPLFALGVLLAMVVEWSGGVLPAMLAHGLWNLYQLLVPLVVLAP